MLLSWGWEGRRPPWVHPQGPCAHALSSLGPCIGTLGPTYILVLYYSIDPEVFEDARQSCLERGNVDPYPTTQHEVWSLDPKALKYESLEPWG